MVAGEAFLNHFLSNIRSDALFNSQRLKTAEEQPR
jgi:hypothetical protein